MLNKWYYLNYFNKLSQGKGQSVGDTCDRVRLPAFPYSFTTKTKQMKHSKEELKRRRELLLGIILSLIAIAIVQNM
jgi:hypothetical protein